MFELQKASDLTSEAFVFLRPIFLLSTVVLDRWWVNFLALPVNAAIFDLTASGVYGGFWRDLYKLGPVVIDTIGADFSSHFFWYFSLSLTALAIISKIGGALLIKEKLAACISISPSNQSIYRWQGEVISDVETKLTIKTKTHLVERVFDAIKSHHPYELPELIAITITAGSDEYLNWLDSNLRD